MAKFLVETYSIHKLQYVVECDSAETAQTEVACNTEDLIDLHQEHLDENVFGVWEISDAEFEHICSQSINGHLREKVIRTVKGDK